MPYYDQTDEIASQETTLKNLSDSVSLIPVTPNQVQALTLRLYVSS